MSTPRPEEVARLSQVALDAMEKASNHTTADEVLSACFSLALRALAGAVACGVDVECFRAPLEQLYAELPPHTRVS